MSNATTHLSSVLELSINAFEIAEAKRYEKLRRASHDCGPVYADVNLNGTTMKEILGYQA